MKTDRTLEDIKSRTDIVDLISDYVQLKKSGQNWKGLCPFHAEKTPSFMVNRAKQTFHCFGCGAGGDVISFVSKYENLSFIEALRLLAKKAGVALPERRDESGARLREEKIRSALSDAALFYAKKLEESAVAKEYLKKRGITAESAALFGLGYAPAGWSNLLKHLKNAGYDEHTMREAGLVVQGEKGVYDMFRERIIFPITSIGGNVLAFGGRAFGDAKPKYINSPETPVFKKSDTVFGLSLAKEAIRRENRVLIVEGYMDVIVCHQHGFRNAVAPLGTSLTPGHIQRLRTLAGRAVLVFDGDAAGKAAAKRALSLICQNNYSASVLVLPDEEDPDSYLGKYGAQSFSSLLAEAKTMIDFLLGFSGGGKTETVREALALIASVGDPLAAEEMLVELSDKSRMNETTIRRELKKLKGGGPGSAATLRAAPSASDRNSEEYLLLLSSVIAFPEKSGGVLSRIEIGDIMDGTVAGIFRKLADHGGEAGISVILRDADDNERRLLTRLSVEPGFDRDNVDSNIEGCLRKIELRKFEEKLSLADKAGDLNRVVALLREKTKFIEGTKDAR